MTVGELWLIAGWPGIHKSASLHAEDGCISELVMGQSNSIGAHLVTLLRQLVEEEVCQVLDAGVGVLQAQSHSCNVALHLHHVVHDQVGQNHQAVLSHTCIAHSQQWPSPASWLAAH